MSLQFEKLFHFSASLCDFVPPPGCDFHKTRGVQSPRDYAAISFLATNFFFFNIWHVILSWFRSRRIGLTRFKKPVTMVAARTLGLDVTSNA
jgi:hypothetical protein